MSDGPELREIQVGEIPTGFRDDLSRVVLNYSVNLVGLRGDARFAHCGSGTLVRAGTRHFVLTAAHCARELVRWDAIGLVLAEFKHRLVIPNADHVLIAADDPNEWGPDIAFVPIPPNVVGTIGAMKSFYPLSDRSVELLTGVPDTDRGLWAFVGAPAERCDLSEPANLEFQQTVHYAGVDRFHDNGAFDFADVGIPCDAPDLPRSFGGVSGGGLWQVDIAHNGAGKWGIVGTPVLEGVAFYQTASEGGRFFIRCHGRRSIYEHGLRALRGRGLLSNGGSHGTTAG